MGREEGRMTYAMLISWLSPISHPIYKMRAQTTEAHISVIPPIVPLAKNATTEQITAHDIITHVHLDVQEAQDNPLAAKICQAYHANEH
jgi:hypothetical protein